MPTLHIGTTSIPYTIEVRPRRRHLAIQVDQRQQLKVLVPSGYPYQEIEPFLLEKSRWILHHITKPISRWTGLEKQFIDGDEFRVRGTMVRLRLGAEGEPGVDVDQREGILRVGFPDGRAHPHPTEIRDAVVRWYRALAAELLVERVAHYRVMVGRGPAQIKISEYKARWGYCRGDGLIAFNWRIVQAPDPVIDYVVVHELTHLQHPHHQKRFWEALEDVTPDFRIQKQWLREHGAELTTW